MADRYRDQLVMLQSDRPIERELCIRSYHFAGIGTVNLHAQNMQLCKGNIPFSEQLGVTSTCFLGVLHDTFRTWARCDLQTFVSMYMYSLADHFLV